MPAAARVAGAASKRSRALLTAAVATALAAASCAQPAPPGPAANADVEWAHYGGDAGGTKYSPLTQIDRDNVARLEVAWMVRAADFPPEIFDPHGHRAGARR